MPWWKVLVTRDATESATVSVKSANRVEAEAFGLKLAQQCPNDLIWETDEGNDHPAYLPDPGNCAKRDTKPTVSKANLRETFSDILDRVGDECFTEWDDGSAIYLFNSFLAEQGVSREKWESFLRQQADEEANELSGKDVDREPYKDDDDGPYDDDDESEEKWADEVKDG